MNVEQETVNERGVVGNGKIRILGFDVLMIYLTFVS